MFNVAKSLMESALSASFLADISKWIRMNNSSAYGDFWSGIQDAYLFIQVIGFGLMATFFLKALLAESAKDNLTIETLGRMMIGLVLSLAVITHIPQITNAFLKISETGASYVLTLQETDNNGDALIVDAINKWYEENGAFKGFFQGLLFFVIHQVCVIAFDFAIISRAIDIGWRVAIAPISCADMFEGTNSPGIKHLKSIFGSALIALLLAIIAKAGTLLMAGFIQDTTDGSIYMALACQVAIAGAAIGANQKAREIL